MSDMQRRIDESNAADGRPIGRGWVARLNDAYWLGWRDSQEAIRRSGEAAQALSRKPWWRRLLGRLHSPGTSR